MHRARHFKKRQVAPVTSVGGFDGETTANTAIAPSETSLAFDNTLTNTQAASAPGLAPTPLVVTTGTSISTIATSPGSTPSDTSDASSASSSNHSVPTGTVIGVVVGTLVVLLIAIFALCWTRSRDKALRRVPASAAFRNMNGDLTRRKSGREAWAKLPEDKRPAADEWTGMSPMRQTPGSSAPFVSEKAPQLHSPPPVSPLDTFKFPSPTHTPKQTSFDEYRPGLAEELAQPQRLFLRENAGANGGNPSSWGGDTLRDSSFLSLKSVSGVPIGASAALAAALPDHEPTPRQRDMSSWDPDVFADADLDDEPIALDDSTSAIHNPFADAHDVSHRHKSSDDSHSSRQSAGTLTLQVAASQSHQEREREMRAMKNLIAALDHTPPSSVVGGSAAPSLHPTAHSRVSAMSEVSDYSQYDDTVVSFPAPPGGMNKGKASLR